MNVTAALFLYCQYLWWYAWSRSLPDKEELKIRWLPLPHLLLWLVLCVSGIALITMNIDTLFHYFMHSAIDIMQSMGMSVQMLELEPDAYPFLDSCITVLSMAAMLLMTRKYVENWLLWIVVNLISIVIFALQGVYFMVLEYVILTFIAANGLLYWSRRARENSSHLLTQ